LEVRDKNKPLIVQIQIKREEMFACARKNGYNSDETLACSQELDKLIYEYQTSVQSRLYEQQKESPVFSHFFGFLHRMISPARSS
jgi:hypothetical protein